MLTDTVPYSGYNRAVAKRKNVKIRHILLVIELLGLGILIALNAKQFHNVFGLLKQVRWYLFLAVIAVQLTSYYTNARCYRSVLRIFGYQLSTRRLFQGALAANFVNYIMPSVGIGGAGYLSQVLSPDVPRGEGILTQFMRYAFSSLAVLTALPVGVLLLVLLSHHPNHAIIHVAIISVIFITVLAGTIIIFLNREKSVRQTTKWLIQKVRYLFPNLKSEPITRLIDEFYVGYHQLRGKKRRLMIPYGWSIVYITIEIATLYLAFIAFHHTINPGIAILAYVFANVASVIGGSLFSFGVYELGMAGTLVSMGIPFALAVSVTAVYRIINLLIGLPPGFYYYKKYLPRS